MVRAVRVKTVKTATVTVKSCRFFPYKRLQCGSQDKCCTTCQMISYHMLRICDGSGGSLQELSVALFGLLHPGRQKQVWSEFYMNKTEVKGSDKIMFGTNCLYSWLKPRADRWGRVPLQQTRVVPCPFRQVLDYENLTSKHHSKNEWAILGCQESAMTLNNSVPAFSNKNSCIEFTGTKCLLTCNQELDFLAYQS